MRSPHHFQFIECYLVSSQRANHSRSQLISALPKCPLRSVPIHCSPSTSLSRSFRYLQLSSMRFWRGQPPLRQRFCILLKAEWVARPIGRGQTNFVHSSPWNHHYCLATMFLFHLISLHKARKFRWHHFRHLPSTRNGCTGRRPILQFRWLWWSLGYE